MQRGFLYCWVTQGSCAVLDREYASCSWCSQELKVLLKTNKQIIDTRGISYWQCLQVISHISVNVTVSCGFLTEPYSGDQLTCNFVL